MGRLTASNSTRRGRPGSFFAISRDILQGPCIPLLLVLCQAHQKEKTPETSLLSPCTKALLPLFCPPYLRRLFVKVYHGLRCLNKAVSKLFSRRALFFEILFAQNKGGAPRRLSRPAQRAPLPFASPGLTAGARAPRPHSPAKGSKSPPLPPGGPSFENRHGHRAAAGFDIAAPAPGPAVRGRSCSQPARCPHPPRKYSQSRPAAAAFPPAVPRSGRAAGLPLSPAP